MRNLRYVAAASLLWSLVGCTSDRRMAVGSADGGTAVGADGRLVETDASSVLADSNHNFADATAVGLADCSGWDGSFDAGVGTNGCDDVGDGGAGLAPFEALWEVCGDSMFFINNGFALKDGVIYSSVGTFHDTKVMAIDGNANVLFERVLPAAVSFPAVGDDGVAYFDHGGIGIKGFARNGALVSDIKVFDEKPNPMWVSSPAVAVDGTVYAGLNWTQDPADVQDGTAGRTQYLFVAANEGKVVWKDQRYTSAFGAPPVIDNDGTIFVTQTGYKPKDTPLGKTQVSTWVLLKGLDASGRVKWALDLKWKEVHSSASPMVLNGNGLIFLKVDEKLFGVRNCGEKLWELTLPDLQYTQGAVSLRVDPYGNILLAAALDPAALKLDKEVAVFFVIDPTGRVLKERRIEGFYLYAEIVLLSDGTFLAAGFKPDKDPYSKASVAQLFRLDRDLNIVEERSWPSVQFPIAQIGFDGCGQMYMVATKIDAGANANDYCLYKIRVSPGLGIADAPWPLERGDMARTGRVHAK